MMSPAAPHRPRDHDRPDWQLPPGVTRGLWDYVNSHHIADDYDQYFAENRLFEFDQQVIQQYLLPGGAAHPTLVADLGCGTGRALVPLVRRGCRGLAVDLSQRMLEIVRAKAAQQSLPIACVRANLVDLTAIADGAVDHAISLFSTLGMIRGRENRRLALGHVRRIVRPGGVFVLHVHNYWYNLYDPGGPWWLLKNLCRAGLVRDVEAGDKKFAYRGVPNMFLHVFTMGEVRRALRRAGFRIERVIPLDPRRNRQLAARWFAPNLRANGWIVISR